MGNEQTQTGLSYSDLPELYQKADKAAVATQTQYFRLVRFELIAVVLAALAQFVTHPLAPAIAGALQLKLGAVHVLTFTVSADTLTNAAAASLVPGVLVAIVLLTAVVRFLRRPDEKWRSQRALAEATAGLAWRYSMRAMPSDLARPDLTGPEGDEAFSKSLDIFLKEAGPLNLPPPGPNARQLTNKMTYLRHQVDVNGKRSAYLAGRLQNQKDYYTRRSNQYHSRRNSLRLVMMGAYAVGVVLLPFNGLGVMTTAAGAFGTWLGNKHYDDLYQIYSGMARQLETIQVIAEGLQLDGEDAAVRWAKLVDQVETLLEGEHRDWLAHVARAS
jgi:hypothetical protein